jgi:hypothetical protein
MEEADAWERQRTRGVFEGSGGVEIEKGLERLKIFALELALIKVEPDEHDDGGDDDCFGDAGLQGSMSVKRRRGWDRGDRA